MDIFNDLVNIMFEIDNIYLKLCRLELLGELNSNYFFELVGALKIALIKEEELFSQFVKTLEFGFVKEEIVNESGSIFSRFKDYIKLYDTVNMELDDMEQEELAAKLRKIYESCSKNIFLIYLSFLQEYIDTTDNVEMKERMLNLKYYNAFTKLIIGQILIENDFRVSKNNYVDLYLVADLTKIDSDVDSYDVILDGNINVINEMLKQLFSIDDKRYNDLNVIAASKGIEFMIRACFSLLSNNEYESIKDDIFVAIDELSNNKNNRAGEIVNSIIESRTVDRCRVRKVSLKPFSD